MTNCEEIAKKRDYREAKGLKSYIYNPDTNSGDYEFCPNCNGAIKTSNIEVADMQDGDCDYGVCPHYFEPEICSVEEFETEMCVKFIEEQ